MLVPNRCQNLLNVTDRKVWVCCHDQVSKPCFVLEVPNVNSEVYGADLFAAMPVRLKG